MAGTSKEEQLVRRVYAALQVEEALAMSRLVILFIVTHFGFVASAVRRRDAFTFPTKAGKPRSPKAVLRQRGCLPEAV